MGKESVWQRRARKVRSGKADYYPKVDLADEMGSDALARIEALATSEAAPAPDAEPAALELADAEPIEAEAVEALEIAEAAPAAVELEVEAEAAAPAPEPVEEADRAAATPLAADEAVRLPEFLDLAAAAPLAKTLLERRGQPIVIDGSAVHQVGAQCVQVLLSARKTWRADGVPLSIVNCAPRMIEDLQFLGIESATLISGDLSQ